MSITIQNPTPAIAADPRILGSALKIIIAGGARLSPDEARRASGLSDYHWRTYEGDVRVLAERLIGEI